MEPWNHPSTLARLFDHTLLKATATASQIRDLCTEAKAYGFASVCVNPCHVDIATNELEGTPVKVITVVGFPLGASTTTSKVFETTDAIHRGAREIDMVVNLSLVLAGDVEAATRDMAAVVDAAAGCPVKVILETGYLDARLIEDLTVAACKAGAKFVKTSTGFGPRGASVEDVRLMARALGGATVGIKAAGGIRNLEDVKAMVRAGATRIGASSSVSIMEQAGFARKG